MYCKKCKQDLDLSLFDKWKTGGNKHQPYCRQCNRIRLKDYMRLKRGLIGDIGSSPAACEGCGSDEKLSMDHSHSSGKFRGWLCTSCNMTLGLLKDNSATLLRLSKYLENNA